MKVTTGMQQFQMGLGLPGAAACSGISGPVSHQARWAGSLCGASQWKMSSLCWFTVLPPHARLSHRISVYYEQGQ